MRPYALIEDSPESLVENEISCGKLLPPGANGHTRKSFDILLSFREVLGKAVGEVPDNYERDDHLLDTGTDLETNALTGLIREHSLLLQRGKVSREAVVKTAQSFRSGTNDIDAVTFESLGV